MENPKHNCHFIEMENRSPLHELRQDIDSLDRALIDLLAKREKLVERVLAVKKVENIPGRIPARVDIVISNACQRAAEIGMNPDLAKTVWSAMVEWFVQHEEQQLKGNPREV